MPARPAPGGIVALHFIPEGPLHRPPPARHPGCERSLSL